MAQGPTAPKQKQADGGSRVSMCTAMSQTDPDPFTYTVDVSPQKLEVWEVNRAMHENVQSVFLI